MTKRYIIGLIIIGIIIAGVYIVQKQWGNGAQISIPSEQPATTTDPFPIEIRDAQGTVIGSGIAQAQGDWMTSEFVPFKAVITFTKPATDTGTIVLKKDNPSGLPKNDAEVSIPVRFK